MSNIVIAKFKKRLSAYELFALTGFIGHIDTLSQLEFIIRFTQARIAEVKRQRAGKRNAKA